MLFLSLPSIGKVFFHLELFQYFLFIFGSCSLNMVYQRVDYWAFILLDIFLSFLDLWFGVLSLILENSQSLLLWVFLLFLFVSEDVWNVSHSSWIWCSFLKISSHFSLFQVGEFPLTYFQSYWFFPWPCPVYWWVHSSFLLVFLISRILFWFFLRVYGFAYVNHLFLNVVWFFPLTTFNILIINYLTFLCDNSKICAISEFSFDAYFVSSGCLFLVY